MPEFKNHEEYQKWKTDKGKQLSRNQASSKEIKQPESVKTKSPYVENKSPKKKTFLFIGIILIILIPAVYFLWSYMTHGHLSGNVYLTMQSGDVKKAAGIEVYLLTVAQPEDLIKEIEQKKTDADLAIIGVYKDKEMEYLKEDADYYYKMTKQAEENAEKYTIEKDYYNNQASKYRDEFIEKSKKLKPFWEKIAVITKEHNKKVGDLLFSGKNNKIKTDVNGVYEFQGLKRGKYLLLARYKVFDNKITWLTVAEIKTRENKLDLTTNNSMREIFYDEALKENK